MEVCFSDGLFSNVPAFMSIKHLDLFEDTMSFLCVHIALLCLLILRTWICCWLQFRRTCIHVFGFKKLHMRHVIDGYVSCPKNSCFLAFSMYGPCVSFSKQVFCESVILLCFCLSKNH